MRTFTTLGLLALGILAGCYTPGVNEDKLAEKIGSAVGSKLASASVETNAKSTDSNAHSVVVRGQ